MKMILVKFLISIFWLVCINRPASSQTFDKSVPYNYYPDEYRGYNEMNWSSSKKLLDSLLTEKDLNQLERSKLGERSWFLLARLVDINWSKKQKTQVVKYLERFVSNLIVAENSFFPPIKKINSYKDYTAYDPIYIPHKAIWAMTNLDENLEIVQGTIVKCWKLIQSKDDTVYINNSRISLISSITKKYKNENAYNTIQTLIRLSKSDISGTEKELIENFLLKFTLSKLEQDGAWEYLLNKTVNATAISNSVKSKETHSIWYSNIMYMLNVFPDLKIANILDQAAKTDNKDKVYIYLYCATFLINYKSTNSGVTNKEDLNFLSRKVNLLYKDKISDNSLGRADVSGKISDSDYLQKALNAMMKMQIKKP